MYVKRRITYTFLMHENASSMQLRLYVSKCVSNYVAAVVKLLHGI